MAATGNYRRRIKDIPVAIKTLDDRATLLDAANFLVLYFACEKLAKAMIGIDEDEPVEEAFDRRYMPTERIKKAACKAAITFSGDEITRLFEYQNLRRTRHRAERFEIELCTISVRPTSAMPRDEGKYDRFDEEIFGLRSANPSILRRSTRQKLRKDHARFRWLPRRMPPP